MGGILARTWLVAQLAVALAACDVTPAERAATLCSVVCGCQQPPLPGLQRQCVDECTSQFRGDTVSDACLACVSEHADRCSSLESDCAFACSTTNPTVDAGITF
jgi:hypothetical protein